MPGPTFAANDVDYIAKLNQLSIGLFTPSYQTSGTFNAVKGFWYLLGINAGTVTLPAAPADGDRIKFSSGAAAVTSVTLARNSLLIDAVAANLTLTGSRNAVNVELVYDAINGKGWVVAQVADSVASPVGKQTLWIPAGAMIARVTNGPSAGAIELATNRIMLQTLDFDAAAAENAQFAIRMPKSWDEGTVTFAAVWSHATTTVNFGAVWGLRAMARSDNEAMDTAMGTGVTVTDTGGTTSNGYITAESAAITIGSTPTELDLVVFEVYRDATNGADTMAIDARLHGVHVYFATNAVNDA